jgi:hypothetical protein
MSAFHMPVKCQPSHITKNNHKLKIFSEHFEFRHFRPHYLDVDTVFGDLGVNV